MTLQYCLSLRPFHTWLRLLSPHILYSTHSTLCVFTSLHYVLMLHSCSESSVNYNRTSKIQFSPCWATVYILAVYQEQSQELAIYWYGSIIIFAWFSQSSRSNTKLIRSREHNHCSTRASRLTAHTQCFIRAGRSTAHHFHSIRAGCPRARAMSASAGNDATDIVAIEVNGDDAPLSSAFPEVVRLPLWDDLGRS